MRKEKLQLTLQRYKKIIRGYYEQWFAIKLERLEEMDTFLKTHNNLRLNQEELSNLDRLITSSKTELVL